MLNFFQGTNPNLMNGSTRSKLLLIKIIRSLVVFYVLLGFYGWFFSESAIFFPPSPSYSKTSDLVFVKGDNGQRIAATYYKNDTAKYTILYSHGNATDLGYLQPLLNKFYKHGYSVLAYDYSGYGLSSGKPSEQQAYKDIAIVYAYLVNQLKTPPEKIIVYGHSLGTAISTELAAHENVAALVLESPFVSAFRVRTVYPLYPFDKFANLKKIPAVSAPVYIMHSRDAPIIAFWHAELLYEAVTSPKMNYWLDHAGHNDIPYSGDGYWHHLESFIDSFDSQPN